MAPAFGTQEDILRTITDVLKREVLMDGQNGRFKSWEHCYKFFSEPTLDRRTASLHLGFYLASWGMYRGSAPIFRKDFTIHNDAVCLLMSDKYGSLKDLKIESVTQDNFNLICDLIDKISEIYTRQLVDLKPNDNKINHHNFKEDKSKVPSETLITNPHRHVGLYTRVRYIFQLCVEGPSTDHGYFELSK